MMDVRKINLFNIWVHNIFKHIRYLNLFYKLKCNKDQNTTTVYCNNKPQYVDFKIAL